MSEERIVELETRLAHQEHIVAQLNAVVTAQQDKIDQLTASLTVMVRRYQAAAESAPDAAPIDETPPHY